MCGIVLSADRAFVERGLITLAHRGRDYRHIAGWGGMWLGFNRMAIVDIQNAPAALQPLETRNTVTAFNGEIFNRGVLRNALEESGLLSTPVPATEIEVIDAIIERHPRHFHRFLDGYYGIVQIDKGRQQIVAARDFPGVIPLYYQKRPFAIASESKVLNDPIEIQPGQTITFNFAGKIQRVTTFDPVSLHMEPMDIEHLAFLFARAVQRRISHAEVGVCIALSGGLDSSLILAQAVALGHRPNAVTIAMDPYSIEAQNAMMLCTRLDVPLKVIQIGQKTIELHHKQILWHLEDYKNNTIKYAAMIRNYFTALHAPGKVILCGEGADELGCGYPPHLARAGLELEWKAFSTLRSMHAINLDRVNKGGMAWTKEFRTPFLDRALILYCMGCEKEAGKSYFKILGEQLGLPKEILRKEKYSTEEQMLWGIVANW